MSVPTPATDVRSRLQGALRAAMKERDTVAVSGLRSALAAIANAEAVPLPPEPSRPEAGSEIRRRDVTENEATRIAAAEAAEHRAAARDNRAAGHADRADRLVREADAIESALYTAARRDDA
jgi:uncharacterized protein YqeY